MDRFIKTKINLKPRLRNLPKVKNSWKDVSLLFSKHLITLINVSYYSSFSEKHTTCIAKYRMTILIYFIMCWLYLNEFNNIWSLAIFFIHRNLFFNFKNIRIYWNSSPTWLIIITKCTESFAKWFSMTFLISSGWQ